MYLTDYADDCGKKYLRLPPQSSRGSLRIKIDTYAVFEAIVIHVKVRGVRGAADFRDVGGFAVADVVPVDTREKRVLFEVLNAVLAQPVFSAADEPSDQIFSIF